MRKFLAALVLTFILVSASYSSEPSVYTPIPSELFAPIIIDPILETTKPIIKPTIEPSPIIKIIKPDPTKAPKPQIVKKNNSVSGVASWYCRPGLSRCTYTHPTGGYFAAIRRDLLELQGQYVLVCEVTGGRCVTVKIIDCNCGVNANLIDLYWDAFIAIHNPNSGNFGTQKVVLKW